MIFKDIQTKAYYLSGRSFFITCAAFLFSQTAFGQYAFGVSDVFYDKRSGTTLGFSMTELDYTAALYYDADVVGSLYEDTTRASEITSVSKTENFRAIVWTQSRAIRNPETIYGVYSDHFVKAHFYFPSPVAPNPDDPTAAASAAKKRWYDPLGFNAYNGSYNVGWYGFRGRKYEDFFEDAPAHHLCVTNRGWQLKATANR